MHDETLRNTLSERFEGYSSPPSDALWDSIEKVLDEDEKAAGFRFNLLSPLVITLLIGSSAAALALCLYFSDLNATSSFPLADGGRTHATQTAKHAPHSLPADVRYVETPHTTQTILSSPEQSKKQIKTLWTDLQTRTVAALPLKSLEEISALQNSCMKQEDPNDALLMPERAHEGLTEEDLFDPVVPAPSSLHGEFLLSSFATLNGYEKNSPYDPNYSETPQTFNNAKYITKSARFVEAELNFQGKIGKRFKGALGISLGYSEENGGLGESTVFETTQWSIGIPLTFGMEMAVGERFGLSFAAKLLNDFDQRKRTSVTQMVDITTLSPTFYEDIEVSKDQVYRFGFQPMITGSYYMTPRTALSLGLSYRHYLNDSRTSNVSFQRSHYLGVHLGLGFVL